MPLTPQDTDDPLARTMAAMKARREGGETSQAFQGNRASVSTPPDGITPSVKTADPNDPLERTRAALRWRHENTLGFGDAMREVFSEGGWKEKLPFLGGAATAEKYHALWEASSRIEKGTQSADDENLVLAFIAESQKPQGIGYMVGSILAELPGFVAEFAASGGAWSAGKKGALLLATKGMKQAIEKAGAKLSMRAAKEQLKKGAVAKAAGTTVARGIQGLANTAGQLGAMTAFGEMAGGSRIRGEAWRRALPEMSLTVDDADRLNLVFHSSAGEFMDELPAAALDQFIEILSERSGAGLMTAAGKIPGIGYVGAMQAQVAQWWTRKYSKGMGAFLNTVAKKGGWHGPVSEFLEERYGGALRGATGIEDGGILENTFPGMEQMAAELIAFSVPTVAGGALTASIQAPEPEDRRAGFERPSPQTGRPTTTSEISRELDAYSRDVKQPLEPVEGKGPAHVERARAEMAKRGLSPILVKSEDDSPLKMPAKMAREGLVFLDVNMVDDPAAIGVHELAGQLYRVAPETADALRAAALETDKESFEGFLAEYETIYEESTGRPLAEDKKASEAIENYAEARAELIWYSTTDNGRKALQATVQNKRSAAQKVLDWLVGGLNTLGLKIRTAQEIRLERIGRVLGMKETPTKEAVEVSLLFQEAIDTMIGMTPISERIETPALEGRERPKQLARDAEGPRAMPRGERPARAPKRPETPEVIILPGRPPVVVQPEEPKAEPQPTPEVVQFASGLTRSPADADKEIEAGRPVGVSAHGKVSKPMQQKLIEYARQGGQVFLDSGAFTALTKGRAVDWDRVFDLYGGIVESVDEEDRGNVHIVAPDVVGDHEATFDLLWNEVGFQFEELLEQGSTVIFPVQKGGHGTISANFADLTAVFDSEYWDKGTAIVGIPFNKKAWGQEDVLEFLRKYKEMDLSPRIHLLGGGPAKVQQLLSAAVREGLPIEHIGGDALSKEISERRRGKKKAKEPEVVWKKAKIIPTREGIKTEEIPTEEETEATIESTVVAVQLHEGLDLSKYRAASKEEEEKIELEVGKLANRIANDPRLDRDLKFAGLLDLYNRQPRPRIRTTESERAQQYSTPVPLAYVAGMLAGIGHRLFRQTVYEPTAGHGLLLTALSRHTWSEFAILNELEGGRAHRLEQSGPSVGVVSREDAATWHPSDPYQVVITNPPFGTVLDETLKTTRRTIFFGPSEAEGASFETSLIDHQIVAQALSGLPDDGRAVLIIGSQKSLKGGEEAREKARKRAYNAGQKRLFYRELYKHWNVTDHVTVSGDLYKGQGAAWPVDIIVIEGRGESPLALPGAKPPQVLETWDDVEGLLDPARREAYRKRGKGPSRSGGRGPGSVPPSASDEGSRPGDEGGEGEPTGAPGALPGETGVGAGGQRTSPGDGGESPVPGPGARTDEGDGADRGGVAEPSGAEPEREGGAEGGQPGDLAGGAGPAVDIDALINDEIDGAFEEEPPELVITDLRSGREVRTIKVQEQPPTSELAKRVKAKREAEKPAAPPKSAADQAMDDIAGLFAVSRAQRSEAFKRWFRDSVVKDEQGNPLVVYHGTVAPRAAVIPDDVAWTVFRQASHFGTAQAAEDRVESRRGGDPPLARHPRIFPVYLRIQNPLHIPDLSWGTTLGMLQTIEDEIGERVPRIRFGEEYSEGRARQDIEELLNEYGYDGISYVNKVEDPGSTSWVALNPEQIKSATGNRGTYDPDNPDVRFAVSRAQKAGLDQAKYEKMRPVFAQKVDDAGIDPSDYRGIVRTIVEYFKTVHQFTKKQVQSVQAYLKVFVEDVIAGDVTWGERTAVQPRQPERALPEPTDRQINYEGASETRPMGTLIPKNMQTAITRALDGVARREESVDDFVAHELGWSKEQLANRLGQEQVDAVALAIDNIQKGAAFVDGDQTGVGKGRVVASMIHWARRNGYTPVFMTHKAELYEDMYRDLYAIGVLDISPFVTNRTLKPILLPEHPLSEKQGFLRSHGAGEYRRIADAARAGALPEEYNAVFTTYAQAGIKGGQRVARHLAIEGIAPRSIFLLDESHNAGGKELTPKEQRLVEEGKKYPVAEWVRRLIDQSAGAMFASATFAKNPYVMSLYAKTDMSKAFGQMGKLQDLIKIGGVPFQQVLSNMLVESGQYVRRERSFEGVSFTERDVDVSEESANVMSGALSGMFWFDLNTMQWVREKYRRDLLPSGGEGAFGDTHVGDSGADGGFASVMHNLISQGLLSMKANAVADEAIAEWRAGRKPIIGLDSTMGAILEKMREKGAIGVGQRVDDISFRFAMGRYLEALRTISLMDDNGKLLERVYITDADFAAMGEVRALEQFQEMEKMLEKLELGEMTLSPIDAMLHRMQAAGMKVGEVTGRQYTIKFSKDGKSGKLEKRTHNPSTKTAQRKAFNSGELDALIINRSGATGISLHASEGVTDQRQRIMLIAQPAPNIDDYKQMLGRIHRTGQVEERIAEADEDRGRVEGTDYEGGAYGLPIYRVMFATLPQEARAKAVLQSKMAQLNANTTAMAMSGDQLADVTDFINKHGDQVVREVLIDEGGQMTSRLHLYNEVFGDHVRAYPGLASKASGRLPLLPVEDQRRILRAIDEGFKAHMAYLDSIGQNDLEATLEELDAKTVSSEVRQQETGPSPFEGAVYEERVDVKKLRPPIPFEEMEAKVEESDLEGISTGILEGAQELREERKGKLVDANADVERRGAALAKYRAEIADKEYDEEDSPEAKRLEKLEGALESAHRWVRELMDESSIDETVEWYRETLPLLKPGTPVSITRMVEGAEAERIFGLVTAIRRKGRAKSALSPSDYEFTVYSTATTGPLHLSLSKVKAESIKVETLAKSAVKKAVEAERESGREERSILTGNLVRAAEKMLYRPSVQLVMYRTSEGEVKSGVLLPPKQTAVDILGADPLKLSPDQAVRALGEVAGVKVSDANGVVTLSKERWSSDFVMELRTRRGRVYRQATATPFERVGSGPYRAVFGSPQDSLQTLRDFERIQDFQLQVVVPEEKDRVRGALGIPPGTDGGNFAVSRAQRRQKFMGFDMSPETRFDWFRRSVQDKDIRIRRFEEQLLSRGGVVPEQFSTYLAIERFPGKVETHLRRWGKSVFDPLIKHLADSKISADDADWYEMNLHAPERNAHVAQKHRDEWTAAEIARTKRGAQNAAARAQEQIDELDMTKAGAEKKLVELTGERARQLRIARRPALHIGDPPSDLPFQDVNKNPGSGVPTKAAEKVVREFEAGENGAAFIKLGEMVDAMNRRTRKIQLASGLISQATHDRWAEQYEHYVPLRTAVENQGDAMGQRFHIDRPESREARGRSSTAHSPIGWSILQAERAIVRGHKNEVGNTFLQLIEANPELMRQGYDTREELEFHEEEEGEQIPREPLPAEGEFTTKVKGREVFIRIKDPLVLRALKNIGNNESGPAVRIFGTINRWLAMANTSLDPGFMLSNFTRDLQTSGINLAGEQSGALARRVVGATLSGKPVRGAWRGLRGKKTGDEWEVWYERMERAGATTGWYGMDDYTSKVKKIGKALADANPSQGRKVWLAVRAGFQVIEDANRAVENGVRLAAFRYAIEEGMSEKQAASLAKNLTVNFNRRGEWGTAINAFYLFYNASLQGNVRLLRALRHRNVQKIVFGIAVASYGLDILNGAWGGDDDDGVPWYDKIPEWVKARNLIFMTPFAGDGSYVKIPLPYGYNIFHAIGQKASALQRGAVNPGQASRDLVSVAWESFYPLGSEASFAQTIMPTLADPLVQIAENKTFWGGPVRPTAYGSPEPPRSQLYWNSVNPIAKEFAQGLNRLTGGDEVVPGAIDLSPEDISHAIEFAVGGFGRQIVRTEEAIANGFFRNEPVEMFQVPILRRVIGQPDDRFDTGVYIENRDDVKRAVKQLKAAAEDPASLRRMRLSRGKVAALEGALKGAETQLRRLRKARKKEEDSKRKEEIAKRMRAIEKRFNQKYRETTNE